MVEEKTPTKMRRIMNRKAFILDDVANLESQFNIEKLSVNVLRTDNVVLTVQYATHNDSSCFVLWPFLLVSFSRQELTASQE